MPEGEKKEPQLEIPELKKEGNKETEQPKEEPNKEELTPENEGVSKETFKAYERFNKTIEGRNVLKPNKVIKEESMENLFLPNKKKCPKCGKEYPVPADAIECLNSHLEYDQPLLKRKGFNKR